MKRILVLGAGLVAKPLVQYLLAVPEFEVIVASRTLSRAERLVGDASNGRATTIHVDDREALERLIRDADLAVSLLPYVYHPVVAGFCVKHGKQMVTTSYVKDAMMALDENAKRAGVVLLNEIGVDPGIDHMSAMNIIHRIHDRNGQLVSFHSNTGGLPAPEANDNPMGYKFSWAPRGVVMAGKNPARFLEDGKTIDIPGTKLFAHHWPARISGFGTLEVYPNRDSLPYIETYGIPEIKTMFRGTLRYPGWCDTLVKIVELGLLDDAERDDLGGITFSQLTSRLIGAESAAPDLREALAAHLGIPAASKPISDLEWLGFLSDTPLPPAATTLLDVLAMRMLERMTYAPGERDMLVMQHEFIAQYADGSREKTTSTMIDYGVPGGDTSMSRTVGLPAAIATRLILQGEIRLTGVQIPVVPEIYEPVLSELEQLGIRFEERTEPLSG
ncbi:saccharopine dehydrogenase NADP-binding domain-containing protein [Candidatus Bipolaricaulota bacterium]|nr:saccharopine dehydrogenase NADP-binding domain-containing protein [Candidatus Bipolaricaulota bacterium]